MLAVNSFLNDWSRKAKATAKGKSGQKAAKVTSAKTAKKTPAKTAAKKTAKTSKRPPSKAASAKSKKKSASSGKKLSKALWRKPSKPRAAAGEDARTNERLPLAARVLILLVAFVAMVGFAVVLSKLTLGASEASESLTHSNLRPGDSIRNYLSQPAIRDTVKQLGGNIVLGMPFGALLPVLAPRTRGLLRVMLATAVVMLLVELVQGALVTGRAFDIDDVILNTTGAMLGYLIIGRRLGRAVHPRRRHWWHRGPVSSSSRGRP